MGFIPSKKHALLALLSGIIFKVYDDVVDMKLVEQDSIYLELIKVSLVCFITLLSIEDIYISLIFLCIGLHCIYIKTTDTPFWKACVLIPIITTVILLATQTIDNLNTITNTALINITIITLIVICNYIENEAYPENKSPFKTLSRIICNGGYIYLLYLVHYQMYVNDIFINDHMTTLIYCGSIFALGYNITNIGIQYLYDIPNDKLPAINNDSSIFYRFRRWVDDKIYGE